jgi:hypothetical protein
MKELDSRDRALLKEWEGAEIAVFLQEETETGTAEFSAATKSPRARSPFSTSEAEDGHLLVSYS